MTPDQKLYTLNLPTGVEKTAVKGVEMGEISSENYLEYLKLYADPLTAEEEAAIDSEIFAATLEALPSEAGFTYEEFDEQVAAIRDEDELEMPEWIWAANFVGTKASEAREKDNVLDQRIIAFDRIFGKKLTKACMEREIIYGTWMIAPYFIVGRNGPRLYRLKDKETTPDDVLEFFGLKPNKKPQKVETVDLSRQSQFASPSNPVVMMGFRGIWNGGRSWSNKKFWAFDEEGQTAEAHYHPRNGGKITVAVDPRDTSAVWTLEEIDKYLQSLSPFTSDVALAVLASLSHSNAPMLEPIIISCDDIRRLKGVSVRGTQRAEFDQRIADEMKNLQRLRFNVLQVKAAVVGDSKNKKWQGQSWANDRLFDIIDIEDWQDDLFGGKERVGIKWSVRAGQWAYYFLNHETRRWVTTMAAALFTLSHRDDRRAEQLAKKIGHFIAFNGWKELKGQPLRWTRQDLLENIGESIEAESKPTRLIAALDEALNLLLEHNIVGHIGQQPREDKQTKGWVKRYLQGEVEFVGKEHLVNFNQLAPAPKKQPTKQHKSRASKNPVSKVDAAKLRRVREERDLNQEAAARDLGISRVYYSGIESGKREPSSELFKRIQKWMM